LIDFAVLDQQELRGVQSRNKNAPLSLAGLLQARDQLLLEKDELHLGIGSTGNRSCFSVCQPHTLHDAARLFFGEFYACDLLDPVTCLLGCGNRVVCQ
jgi:hypothetical protein